MKEKEFGTKILLVLALFFTSCASVKQDQLTFNGMIFNDNNEAVSDVQIYLNNEEITVSDIYGHFTITELGRNNEYVLKAVKNGYETTEITFTFLNASQVLYLHMYSAEELLVKTEELIKEKKYIEAEKFLERAENAEASYLSANYLRAIILYNRKNYEESLSVLKKLINSEYEEAYVYLFMADIYEKEFNNLEETKKCLSRFLEFEYSEDVSERLQKLTEKDK